jgi:hypothetical protein
MMFIIQGCCFIRSLHFGFELQRRLCAEFKVVSSVPLQPSGQRVILSGRRELSVRTFLCVKKLRTVPSYIRTDVSTARPDAVLCSISYWIFFFPKTQIWEDSYNRSDDVYFRPDALIHKQVVHSKFRRPDVSLHGPDIQASYMEIKCSRSIIRTTTVMVPTLGQHRSNAAQFRKEFLRNLESRSHSCPSGWLMSTVQTAPRFRSSVAYK